MTEKIFDDYLSRRRSRAPLFLGRSELLEDRMHEVAEHIAPNASVRYAMKANGSDRILQALALAGLGADVSSAEELQRALSAGVSPETIVVTGPGKSDRDLLAALNARVELLAVDSLSELQRVNRLARRLHLVQDVLIRVSPRMSTGPRGDGTWFFDESDKYGIRQRDYEALTNLSRSCRNASIVGFQCFGASGVADLSAYETVLRGSLNRCLEASAIAGIECRVADVGGGPGFSASGDDNASAYQLGALLCRLRVLFPIKRFVIEPGSWLVAPLQWYAAPIVDVKERGDSSGYDVIINGGMRDICRPVFTSKILVKIVGLQHSRTTQATLSIFGNSCHPLDTIASNVTMDVPEDIRLLSKCWLCLPLVGAYGRAMGIRGFQLRPAAREVWL